MRQPSLDGRAGARQDSGAGQPRNSSNWVNRSRSRLTSRRRLEAGSHGRKSATSPGFGLVDGPPCHQPLVFGPDSCSGSTEARSSLLKSWPGTRFNFGRRPRRKFRPWRLGSRAWSQFGSGSRFNTTPICAGVPDPSPDPGSSLGLSLPPWPWLNPDPGAEAGPGPFPVLDPGPREGPGEAPKNLGRAHHSWNRVHPVATPEPSTLVLSGLGASGSYLTRCGGARQGDGLVLPSCVRERCATLGRSKIASLVMASRCRTWAGTIGNLSP